MEGPFAAPIRSCSLFVVVATDRSSDRRPRLPRAGADTSSFVIVHSVRARRVPEAVLFDRDGTLVVDVAYNGDPARVRPVPGARAALDLLRVAGIPAGVVTNQSGIARGLITTAQAEAVNRRGERLLGPLAGWEGGPP